MQALRTVPSLACQGIGREINAHSEFRAGKVSPDSSPDGQFEGVDEAMESGRRAVENVD